MPRAKFLQTLILNTLGICIGSAVSLLGIWSGVQARKHTTPAGSTERYNSSQAAVCAIWLFANIWFVNTSRAKLPALQFPVIMYSIFTNVAFTYGPGFTTIEQGESLIRQLLLGFLSAFAIGTAVNWFIIPVTCRTVVFKEQAGYIMGIRSVLKAQTTYLQSLESSEMFARTDTNAVDNEKQGDDQKEKEKKKKKGDSDSESNLIQSPQAKALKGALAEITALHGRLHGDMTFAKREIAWGKLDDKDIDEIFALFRGILIPLVGIGTITDIFERIAERRGWVKPQKSSHRDHSESWEHCGEEERISSQKTWNEIMKTLHEPFAVAVAAMDEGLEHAGLVLELLPKPKKKKGDDEEEKGTDPRPGDTGFTQFMEQKMLDFYRKRGQVLRAWAREKGLSEEQFDHAKSVPIGKNDLTPDEAQHRRDQQQLYLILYMENLLYSTGTAITALVRFADKKLEEGTMKRNRLIFPGKTRLKKWILDIGKEDALADTENPDSMEAGTNIIYMGSGFDPKKDPEHLPPQTAWVRTPSEQYFLLKSIMRKETCFISELPCLQEINSLGTYKP